MKKRIISLLLVAVMVLGMLPGLTLFAGATNHDDQVHVIVENKTYTQADGAPWEGTLVDTWVDITNASTMMSCLMEALGGYSQTGAESNYVSEINGLSAFDGAATSGWMGTLNDWFTNEGFGAYTVAAGTLAAGDEIRIMFTMDYGEDLGSNWGDNDKSVQAVSFSAGTLDKSFDSEVKDYTLTVPADTKELVVTPTATNKNFQVRTSVGSTEYKRTAEIPVEDGTVLTVVCGDPSWPSMNNQAGGTAGEIPAETYTFTVKMEQAESTLTIAPSVENDFPLGIDHTAMLTTEYAGEPAWCDWEITAGADCVNVVSGGEEDYQYWLKGVKAGSVTVKATGSDYDDYEAYRRKTATYTFTVVESVAAKKTDDTPLMVTRADTALTEGFYNYVLVPAEETAVKIKMLPTGSKLYSEFTYYSAETVDADGYITINKSDDKLFLEEDSTKFYASKLQEIKTALGAAEGQYSYALLNSRANSTTGVNLILCWQKPEEFNCMTEVSAENASLYTPAALDQAAYKLAFDNNVDSAAFRFKTGDAVTAVYETGSTFDKTGGTLLTAADGEYSLSFAKTDLTATVKNTAASQSKYLLFVGSSDSQTLSVTVTAYGRTGLVDGADRVVDYLCIGSQFSNGGNTATGLYGLEPEKSLLGQGMWHTPISLGNFGGYITYEFDTPITDDSKNPYGIDFIVYGNSNGGESFSEPGNVLVSEDGETWYTLAGSAHYDDDTQWDYRLDYIKHPVLGFICKVNHVLNRTALIGYTFPEVENYPLYFAKHPLANGAPITFTGVHLMESGTFAAFPAWGYADVKVNSYEDWGTNSAGNMDGAARNPYWAQPTYGNDRPVETEADSVNEYGGDGFDLAWAVDANGQTVDLSSASIKYVKVQTASFLTAGAVGEKSTEVNAVVRATAGQSAVGTTAEPTAITVDGTAITLQQGTYTYDAVKVSGAFDVAVSAAKDANIYINSVRGAQASFDAMPTHEIIRIVVQEGEKEPVIYYLNLVEKSNTAPTLAQNVNANGNTASVVATRTWTLDLSTIFTDADGDALTYQVKIGDATAVTADASYSYTPTAAGETTLVFTANDGTANSTDSYTVVLTATLLPADTLPDVGSDWKNFRNSDANMAITSAYTPVSAELATLKWNQKLGSGWSASPSVQIIADNALIVMSGTTLYKLNLQTGETIATATMVAAPSFGYTPPTYAEGMIFCPLGGGKIQAFNAKTLESLWVYADALGGQALSPITYSDGYIYTGFWNGETKDAAFVCLSVTDEVSGSDQETKTAAWRKVIAGGFYWAGSVVVGDAVICGTDNGASGYTESGGYLYSWNKTTGEVISKLALTGDQRSSIAYADGKVYFTTKCGKLYCAVVDASTGVLSNLKSVDFGAQSTSTPVVYKNRVYIGAGSGISSTGSNGNMVVFDATTLEQLFAVGLKGYPQCSMLLSTAYEAADGYLYLYSTYNANPGGVSLIRVKPDCAKAADATLIELYDAAGFNQYCITSIICGKDGTLYYKNDSGNVFAIGAEFAIAKEAAHGAITVKSGSNAVTQAAAGTKLTVTVTANAGWELASLTMNGTAVTLASGSGSFTMPAGTAVLKATYTQSAESVTVVETAPKADVTDIPAANQAAVTSSIESMTQSGLETAADDVVQTLIAENPDKEIKVALFLNVKATGMETSGSTVEALTLDITPSYALYLDGSTTPSETASIGNGKLSGRILISIDAPEGMTFSNNTRIQHGSQWITPYTVTAKKLSFYTTSFSPFVVQADARIASVQYHLNKGTAAGISDEETVDYFPTDSGDKLPTPTKKGSSFVGWYETNKKSGTAYTKVSASLPTDLYAIWEDAETIEVSFRLIGDGTHSDGVTDHDEYVTWIPTTNYTLKKDATVYDLFTQALDDVGLKAVGASSNYVKTIYAPSILGGYALSEFTNGKNSGWMYTVNGKHPDVGLQACELQDDDVVIWHYVDDYTLESNSSFNTGSAQYLNRWLEAADITPEAYVKKNLDKIVNIKGKGTVEPTLKYTDLGKNITFAFKPKDGYQVKDVVVDGKSQGAIESYTYKKLSFAARITVTFTSETWENPFKDVTENNWFYEDVQYVNENGLFDGVGDGLFAPNQTMTRAMLVTVLYRLEGEPSVTGSSSFSDVAAGQWYTKAVNWASRNDIVNGLGGGKFGASNSVTREQMAAILYRYAQYKDYSTTGSSLSGYADAGSVSGWANTAMQWAVKQSLLNGEGGRLLPSSNATRAQVAAIFHRFSETISK